MLSEPYFRTLNPAERRPNPARRFDRIKYLQLACCCEFLSTSPTDGSRCLESRKRSQLSGSSTRAPHLPMYTATARKSRKGASSQIYERFNYMSSFPLLTMQTQTPLCVSNTACDDSPPGTCFEDFVAAAPMEALLSRVVTEVMPVACERNELILFGDKIASRLQSRKRASHPLASLFSGLRLFPSP